MFSVIIVEDEVHILKYMKKKISAFGDFQVKGAFDTPEEALETFDEIQPEVVFLDIEMPRMNGIELARRLLKKKQDLNIIFTTAYSQYALDAFGVEAVDYLMKPITDDDIVRVTQRLYKLIKGKALQKYGETGKANSPVHCFGCFDILDKHQQVLKWPTKKAEELFAYFLFHQGRCVSKWELLELFWTDVAEERGLQNLYNTIYRIKQVLKKISMSTTINKVNDGYILESEGVLSDLGQLLLLTEKENCDFNLQVEEMAVLFFSYKLPLFGMRDYIWGISLQEYVAGLYLKLCKRLLYNYRDQGQFQKAEEVICYYISQHVENQMMMIEWLEVLKNWKGYEKKVVEYHNLFNEKLYEAELPLL